MGNNVSVVKYSNFHLHPKGKQSASKEVCRGPGIRPEQLGTVGQKDSEQSPADWSRWYLPCPFLSNKENLYMCNTFSFLVKSLLSYSPISPGSDQFCSYT